MVKYNLADVYFSVIVATNLALRKVGSDLIESFIITLHCDCTLGLYPLDSVLMLFKFEVETFSQTWLPKLIS